MSHNRCNEKIPLINTTQPDLLFWTHDYCGGTQMNIKGEDGKHDLYEAQINEPNKYPIRYNSINGMWIPPNIQLTTKGCSTYYHNNKKRCKYPERRHIYGTNGGTNLWNNYNDVPGLIGKLKNPVYKPGFSGFPGINDIDELHVKVNKPWEQHLAECCLGTSKGAQCGDFKPGASKCESVYLGDCTADDIKHRTGNQSVKQRFCRKRCEQNPLQCDLIKYEFCHEHPDDKFCSCINLENTPEYKEWAIKYSKKFNIPLNKFSFVDENGKNSCRSGNTDLVNIFLTSSDIKNREQLPPTYNIQDLSTIVEGSDNVLQLQQDAQIEDTKNITSHTSIERTDITENINTENITTNKSNNIILIIVLVVVAAALIGFGFWFTYRNDDLSIQGPVQPVMRQVQPVMRPVQPIPM